MITDIDGAVNALRSTNRHDYYLRIDVPAVLIDVAKRSKNLTSTKHPLGFLHVDLTPAMTAPMKGEAFRLHIWGSDDAEPDALGALHEHTWQLTSLVIVGSLLDRNYVAEPDADGGYEGVRVNYGVQNTFAAEGVWSLRLVRTRVVRAGGIYNIAPRVVHETTLLSTPTVTLVRAWENESEAKEGPLVLVPRGQELRGTPSRERIPATYVGEVLRKLASENDSSTARR
jgi:hypothetical protein